MVDIIEAGGGLAIKNITKRDLKGSKDQDFLYNRNYNNNTNLILISIDLDEVEDVHIRNELRNFHEFARKKGIKIYGVELILTGVLRQELNLDGDEFLITS